MPVERQTIEPLKPDYRIKFLTEEQLDLMEAATLEILETVGVRFPSEKALMIFADHGAHVDWNTQVVKIPPDLIKKALHVTSPLEHAIHLVTFN